MEFIVIFSLLAGVIAIALCAGILILLDAIREGLRRK